MSDCDHVTTQGGMYNNYCQYGKNGGLHGRREGKGGLLYGVATKTLDRTEPPCTPVSPILTKGNCTVASNWSNCIVSINLEFKKGIVFKDTKTVQIVISLVQ